MTGVSRKHRLTCAWLIGVAALAALVLGGVGFGPAARGRRVRLPDGSILVLRGASYGTNHYASPQWLHRSLRAVPVFVWGRVGLRNPLRVLTTPSPSLILWLEWTPATTGSPRPGLALTDRDGVAPAAPSTFVIRQGSPGPTWEAAVSPAACPATAEELRLMVYEPSTGQDWAPAAVIRFRNPARAHAARWVPEPLPSSRRIGEAEVVLESVELKLPADPQRRDSNISSGKPALAEVAWRVPGAPAADFVLDRFEVWDALGQSRAFRPQTELETGSGGESMAEPLIESHDFSVEGGRRVNFLWPFWLSDPAYRLKLEWRWAPDAQFPPGDAEWLRGVRVPEPNGVTPVERGLVLHGHPLRVLALMGPYATLPGREHDVPDMATLEVELDGGTALPTDLRFDVVAAVDDQGRKVPDRAVIEERSIGLAVPPSVRTVDLRLAVYPRLRAEYQIAPRVRR